MSHMFKPSRNPAGPHLRSLVLMLIPLASMAAACGHAPPVTGNRAPGAGPDPNYPEINCGVSNTVDCRPASD